MCTNNEIATSANIILLIFPIKFDHVYFDFLILLEKAIPKSEQYLEDISKVIFQAYIHISRRYINTFHKEKSVHFYKAITVIYFSYTRIYPIFDPCGYVEKRVVVGET